MISACQPNKVIKLMITGIEIYALQTKSFHICWPDYISLRQIPGSGTVSGQSTDEMLPVIKKIIDSIDSIRQEKSVRFENARKYGWEAEQNKLTELIRSL